MGGEFTPVPTTDGYNGRTTRRTVLLPRRSYVANEETEKETTQKLTPVDLTDNLPLTTTERPPFFYRRRKVLGPVGFKSDSGLTVHVVSHRNDSDYYGFYPLYLINNSEM